MAAATVVSGTSPPPRAARPEVVLRVSGVSKSFGTTRALDSCSLELRAGEVHAVVGENGSGKSTLVKVISGIHRPDAGTLELDGRVLGRLASPRAALSAGVATVFQEAKVAGSRSVLENVWLGADGLFRSSLSDEEKARLAQAVLGELLPSPPGLETPAELLSLPERQACCIARALVRHPRILVLDEATSALDIAMTSRLFCVLERLTVDGLAVVFISHRLDEIEEVADRITVLRDGTAVATVERGELSAPDLVRTIAGAAAPRPRRAPAPHRRGHRPPGARRCVCSLTLGRSTSTFARGSSSASPGSRGMVRPHSCGAGRIRQRDRRGHAGDSEHSIPIHSAKRAVANGIAYVPRDRRTEGVFGALTIRENFAVPTLQRDRRGLVLDGRRTEQRFEGYAARLSIRLGSSRDLIGTLSAATSRRS